MNGMKLPTGKTLIVLLQLFDFKLFAIPLQYCRYCINILFVPLGMSQTQQMQKGKKSVI
jgi:hypothetical protein